MRNTGRYFINTGIRIAYFFTAARHKTIIMMKTAEEYLNHFTNGHLDNIQFPKEWLIQAVHAYARMVCEEQRRICTNQLYRDIDYGNVLSVGSEIDILCAPCPEFN